MIRDDTASQVQHDFGKSKEWGGPFKNALYSGVTPPKSTRLHSYFCLPPYL